MRILVLTPQPLVPLHDGLNLRVYHLFREVARSHDVWVLFLDEGESAQPTDGTANGTFAGVHGVPIRGKGGTPFRHCQEFAPEAERAIGEFLCDTPVDAIVAESIYMVPYARALLKRPLLLDLVDDVSLAAWRSLWSDRSWRRRVSRLQEWHFLRRYERRHLPAFRHIVVVGPRDARAVTRYAPRAEVSVIANGVDTEVFQPLPTRPHLPEVVFTGVMGFRPNEAAAIHFYTRILPRIRAEIPEVRVTIAGKGPTRRLRELVGDDPRVTLTGYVEDMRPYIGRATVYVAPMVSGAGIKNKILEAWAMARPVVATPLACEGLEGVPGQTHYAAGSPDTFAEAVIRLLKHPTLGEEIGSRARRLVLERYQWSKQAERLTALLGQMCRRWPLTAGDPVGSAGQRSPTSA